MADSSITPSEEDQEGVVVQDGYTTAEEAVRSFLAQTGITQGNVYAVACNHNFPAPVLLEGLREMKVPIKYGDEFNLTQKT